MMHNLFSLCFHLATITSQLFKAHLRSNLIFFCIEWGSARASVRFFQSVPLIGKNSICFLSGHSPMGTQTVTNTFVKQRTRTMFLYGLSFPVRLTIPFLVMSHGKKLRESTEQVYKQILKTEIGNSFPLYSH